MPRARSPNRDKAFQLWIESKGQKSLQDIAAELGVKPEQVRSWKHADKYNFRHGAYERVMLGLLSEDDAAIFQDEETGLIVEQELRQTLAMLNVKEVRLMRHIANVQKIVDAQKNGDDFLASSAEEEKTGDEFSYTSLSVFKS